MTDSKASAEFPEADLAAEQKRRDRLKLDPIPFDEMVRIEFESGARWSWPLAFAKGRESCEPSSKQQWMQHYTEQDEHIKVLTVENERLRAKLREAQAEIERLKEFEWMYKELEK